jgi:drug/metabolite transporter (DMT)-like permease
MQRQALTFAIVTVIVSLRKKGFRPVRKTVQSVLIALGLFVLPALLLSLSSRGIDGFARTALLSLVPLFALVFEPYLGGESTADGRVPAGIGLQSQGRLAAALAAVVGAAIVFPVSIPSSWPSGLAFCAVVAAAAAIAAANTAATQAATNSPSHARAAGPPPAASFATIAGISATLGFALLSVLTEHPVWNWESWRLELLWSVCIDAPGLLLLFWLLPRTSAVRMTTRFLIAPVIALLIGAALVRPAVEPRMILGLLLMAGGAAWLLFGRESATEPSGLSLS